MASPITLSPLLRMLLTFTSPSAATDSLQVVASGAHLTGGHARHRGRAVDAARRHVVGSYLGRWTPLRRQRPPTWRPQHQHRPRSSTPQRPHRPRRTTPQHPHRPRSSTPRRLRRRRPGVGARRGCSGRLGCARRRRGDIGIGGGGVRRAVVSRRRTGGRGWSDGRRVHGGRFDDGCRLGRLGVASRHVGGIVGRRHVGGIAIGHGRRFVVVTARHEHCAHGDACAHPSSDAETARPAIEHVHLLHSAQHATRGTEPSAIAVRHTESWW